MAIALSLAVLAIDATENVGSVMSDTEARLDSTFASIWIAVAITTNALTAFFIFHTARRRNWARMAMLAWTVGSWSLWFLYPPPLDDFSVWEWILAISLLVMEFTALYLLFRGKGGAWYSLGTEP